MSIQNFKVRNGLNVNSQLVIDGNANGYFDVITANSVVVSGGLQSEDSFARNTANTAVNNAASASLYANTGITLAQAAFNQANTGGGSGLDQYARDTANSAGIYANTAINNAASASQYANTGINNAASASAYANTGINNAASASAYANTGINNAASASVYANAGITLAQASYNQGNSTATVANTAVNDAASASQYANTGINNAASASIYANNGITLAQAAYNEANLKFNSAGGIITGNVTISGNNDLVITGNLYVQGNTVTTNTQSFVVQDPVILLASGNFYTDAKDIGFAAHYNNGTNAHTGFIRDYVTKEYYIFHEYTPELDANNELNINDSSFRTANVHAGYFKGNLIANTAVVEGVNLGTHTQSAFNQANTGVNNAASASLYANTGVTIAQAAYNQANTVQTFAVGGLFTGASFSTGKSNSITFGSPSGAFSDYLGTLTGGSFLAMRLTNTSSGKIYNGYFTLSFAPSGGFVTVSAWTPFLSGDNNPITDGASFSDTTTAEVYTDIYLARNSRVSDSITLAQAAYNAQNSTAIVANAAVTATSTTTLTNKRITLRTANNGATLSGNLTPDSDTTDQYNIIGITGTTNIQIPSGTPTEGQKLIIRIKDDGTGRTLSWVTTGNNSYRAIGVTLPTSTTANKTIYVGCIYNSTDLDWDVVAVATEA